MQKEMQLLDQHLFEDRREITTACVLIHGHPGAGKSHLVRQYIFENRQKFPGGVFWVNAHLIEEVENDFWQISQKVIAKVSPEMMLGSQGPPGYRRYADTVRKWFESRQEWLMVFDGIAIEKEKDLEKLYRFIPDSPNSNIIYISRSRRFEAMDRLLNPVAVKVRPLDESEGRDLLFKELHVERPRAAQLKSATDLVNKIGGLPLAINAIAKRIADTHVPIEKYSMKSYSMDPILGATYRLVVDDLRKNRHKEALNLISIICFFGPHIPVEMIHLGLKALKMAGIEVTSGENGEEPDLNITFGILMRHALIERNEPDDTTSLSGSRDSLVEPEPIDMLKMHTVIQKFCSDSLNASKRLPIWLNHACQLLICSYHEADARIRGRPEPPRLSDYRQYSIHGEQLRQHTLSYESKRQPLEHLRVQLDGTLDNIREKIRSMEPRSSQESVVQQEFQCSIFDRTNTSSSSSNSQTDDASPTNSSHRLYAEANELTDPTFRRTSDSSTRTKVSDRSSQTSAHARIDTCPRSSTAEEAKLRTSQPMQKNPSDTPTLRPSETKPITYGVARQVGFSTPSTTLNTEAAMGSMFRVPSEENPTTSRPSPSALSSLTSFQRPKQQAAKLYESFGPKLFSYGRGQGSQEIAHRGWQSAADEIIETQIPPRISSAPDQSGHQPPFASLAYARGRTGPTYAQHLRSDGQSPSRSEFVRAKSPLAAPMMPPFRDAQRSEALVCNPGYSTTGDTNSKLPLPSQTLVSTSSQGDTSKSLALRSNTMPSTSEQNDVGAPLMEYPLLQSSALSENVGDTLIVYRSSSLTNQPIAFHLAPSTSVTNLQQLPSQQAYQRQSFSIGPAVQDSLFPTSFQSPQVGPIRASESSRLRWLDGSSAQISPQFASNNSSPTMPPHMFSSIHSDVGPAIHTDKEPRARPNLTAIVKNNARETTASHQSRQPQVQSAPLVYSHFSTSNSVVAPSPLSTGAISLSRPTSSGSKTPSGCITDGQGLGIGEFPGQISIPSFAIVPPSDPRRRLRAREGRLTERDVNILVRLPSEENHPLAPKREHFAGVAESGPAPLAPKGPDGQTIISSDDLRAWKPAKRNVGMRSSAPYPEISRFPAGGQSVSVNTLLDMEPEHRRRRSAPESPGWSTVRDSDGWLGQG
ncbi:MAG: hypothetical protein LQ340_000901 [Diploschistes diacapsis]|nr:MAG: hypothetical protein LQ340_000901 [Diploschistes diacapsis]